MFEVHYRQFLSDLMPAVLEAGQLEMRYYASDLEVERKDDKSPVTEADRAAEVILVNALQEAVPSVPVVAEEMVSGGTLPEIDDTFFLVDPLDGTREFINKRDEFTINIGLISAGRPRFGIVYAPALGQLFATAGEDDAVACSLSPDSRFSSLDDLNLKPIRARSVDADHLVAFASRSHINEATKSFLERHKVQDTKQAGSSLKFCLIARGEADVYPRLGPTCEWDTAAGHAVLLAAGGSVVNLDGQPLAYGKRDARFLNPHFIAWGKDGARLGA